MKPNLTTAAIVVALVFSGFLLSRNCGLSDRYKLAKDDYNELKTITETDKKISDEKIEHMTNAIGQADKTIVRLQGVIREKSVQVSGLSRELAELRAAEPSQPELESQPLVINLRAQIGNLTQALSISGEVITTQRTEIDLWGGKFDAAVTIGETWRQSYEKEHKLRILSEGLVTSLEHRVKSQGLLGKVKTVALGVTAGYVAYTLLKN